MGPYGYEMWFYRPWANRIRPHGAKIVLKETDMGSARNIVEKYYAVFDAHREGWKDLVTDDVEFVSPLQTAHGKKEFVALSEQFQQLLRETRVLRRFDDGDSVCSICESVVSTPSGKLLTFTYAEWARVREGRLSEFRIYYDPREFAKAFGIPS